MIGHALKFILSQVTKPGVVETIIQNKQQKKQAREDNIERWAYDAFDTNGDKRITIADFSKARLKDIDLYKLLRLIIVAVSAIAGSFYGVKILTNFL